MNDNLKQSFEKMTFQITSYLKERFGLDFKLVFKVGQTNIKRRPITNEEKFKHLVKKNPKLDEFRKKFGLGF